MSGFAPRFTITNLLTVALTAIERARGFLEAATLSEAWIERMSQQALLLDFPEVSRRSLQRDLRLLLEKGLIRETGSSALTDPNRSYVPAPDRPSRGGVRGSYDKL